MLPTIPIGIVAYDFTLLRFCGTTFVETAVFVKRKFKEPLANSRLRRLGVDELDKV